MTPAPNSSITRARLGQQTAQPENGRFRHTAITTQASPLDATQTVVLTRTVDHPPERFSVLGVKIDAVQISDVILRMRDWIARHRFGHYVAVTGMHGVMEARHDSNFKHVLASADLVVPDGKPLIWIGRLHGHALKRRVYGPELMLQFCWETASVGYRHFLYGGEPGVPEALADALSKSYPGIRVVGTFSPPFGPLTAQQDVAIVDAINQAKPDILWVGLSTPKQETWIWEHRDRLCVPVVVGVGAAFDFLSSRKRQAPAWMRERGLEWFFRLVQEPWRLWRRYLVKGATFVCLVALEFLTSRRLTRGGRASV
jgi:N-acetylglucosaminyldiphosphoundecaprenol N-acetyl-beta-D-mannosaminyltransferase